MDGWAIDRRRLWAIGEQSISLAQDGRQWIHPTLDTGADEEGKRDFDGHEIQISEDGRISFEVLSALGYSQIQLATLFTQ